MSDTYFIKEGYQINPILNTPDHISGMTYWNKSRVQSASYFQFHVYQYAARLMRKNKLRSIIDIGCGVAPKLAYLKTQVPVADITGIDQIDPISYCQKTYDFGKWLVDDFENQKLDGKAIGKVDLIISSDVIEHLENPDNLLSYIKNIASEETLILLSTPERDRMRGEHCMHCPHSQHIREWNMPELRQYLESRGFQIQKHFCIPPYKRNLSYKFIKYELRRLYQRRPFLNNQVALVSLRKFS